MAGADSAAEIGMETIDPSVQERNRHTPAVESAQRDSGSLTGSPPVRTSAGYTARTG